MKYLLIGFLLLLVVYVVYHGIRMNNLRLISAELVKQASSYQQSPNNPTKRLLITGDSLQAGVGASSSENSMAGLLGSDFPRWQITNMAVSGFETGDALEKLEPLSIGGFDLAIVQIGANDIFHLKNLDQSKDNLGALLESAVARADHVVFVTSGSIGYPPLFPAPLDWYFTARSQKFIPEFLAVADSLNIPTLDNYRPRNVDIFESNPNRYYAADGFHLSDAGYVVWHERLAAKLQELGLAD